MKPAESIRLNKALCIYFQGVGIDCYKSYFRLKIDGVAPLCFSSLDLNETQVRRKAIN